MVQWAGGAGPDVVAGSWANAEYGPIDAWGRMGLLVDLAPFIERDAAELNLDDIPSIIQEMGQVDGKWYAIPMLVYTGAAVYYDRDLLQDMGLDDPHPDWTVDEFIAYGQRLTRDIDGDGTVDQWGVSANAQLDFVHMVSAWLYDEAGSRFQGDTPEFLRGARFLQDLFQTYRIAPPPSAGVDSRLGVGSVPVAMAYSWANLTTFLRQSVVGERNFDLQLAPWDRATGTRGALYPDGNFLAISAQSSPEKQEAAWEFIKFFISEAGVKAGYERTGFIQIPSPYVSLTREYFLQPSDPNLQRMNLSVFVDNIAYLLRSKPDRPTAHGGQVSGLLNQDLQDLLDGELAVEVWLETVTPVIHQIMAQTD